MKKIQLFLAILPLFMLFSCGSDSENKLITSRIEYDVQVNNYDKMDGWMNNMGTEERTSFIGFLFDQLNEKKAVDSLGNTASNDYAMQIIRSFHPELDSSLNNAYQLIENETVVVDKLRFREKWEFNAETYQLVKTVLAVAPIIEKIDTNGSIVGAEPLFWVNCDSTLEDGQFVMLTENIITDAIIQNTLDPILAIEPNPKSYFSNVSEAGRVAYFDALLKAATEKKVVAYDYFFNTLPEAELQKLKGFTDTVISYDDNNNEVKTLVKNEVTAKEFGRLKFGEKWEYTKAPFTFRKTVMAVNPSIYMFDSCYGVLRGFKPLFWVIFDQEYLKLMQSKNPA